MLECVGHTQRYSNSGTRAMNKTLESCGCGGRGTNKPLQELKNLIEMLERLNAKKNKRKELKKKAG